MPRRSSGRAGPRKRYTVDAFEGIEGLQDDVPEQPEPRYRDDSDSADDFEATAGAEVEQDEGEDDDLISGLDGDVDGDAERLSEGASDAGEHDLDDGISIADEQDEVERGRHPHKPRAPMPDPKLPGSMYNRGAFDTIRLRGSKFNKRLFFVGPEDNGWQAMIKARDMWQKEDTLPVTLRCHSVGGTGGFHHSFFVNETARKQEIAEAWRWYPEGSGRKQFEQKQELTDMSAEEARGDLPHETGARSVLLGPMESQQLSRLKTGRSASLQDAWQASGSSNGFSTVQSTAGTQRKGFVLNLGAKVRCVEWVPNRPRNAGNATATSQYLVTAVIPDRADSSRETMSAFAPLPSYRSSIQLWRLEATQEKGLDPNHPPVLSMVLCTRWGDARVLRWCPTLVDAKSVPSRHLGLLAGIWGDGGLRVLDLDQPESDSSLTYKRVACAALTAHPPNTVFTSLTWLSSWRIAASTANGCVAIFNIAESLTANFADTNMRPTKYFSAASTYIVSITSALPSHPYILFTTAADGYNRMTDLRHPNPGSAAATLESARGRSTHGAIVWHEWSQCAISIDDNFAMKSLPIRRFFQSVAVARAKSACTAIATSPYHPFILTGTADGEVFGTNPMCRLLDTRQQAIVQIWFAHEWRRPTAEELASAAATTPQSEEQDDPAACITAHGLSRFVEGFKLELISRIYREDNQARKKSDRQNMHFHTIYEEETAVTALAWNSNKDYAGWAAAGMGDGLLRIEDLVPS